MLKVIQAGMLTTIQDNGRFGYLAFGLPRAGYMDRYAARMANILCGNLQDTAVLEMTLSGGAYEFTKSCQIAICGADMAPVINSLPVDMWKTIDVPRGAVLEMGFAQNGCRAYLSIAGGFDVPEVMGSRSTYTRAGVGGAKGRALRISDEIDYSGTRTTGTKDIILPAALRPKYEGAISLRVLLGPQDDMFTDEGLETMFNSEYSVSDEADRMGYRMEGPAIRHKGKADIVSDALCVGAIQVPGNGKPIVMMVDCGTTGGYTKIGTVIGADLSKLAQAKPQDKVRFIRCTEMDAMMALRHEIDQYEQAARLHTTNTAPPVEKKMHLVILGNTYRISITEEDEGNGFN